MKSTISLPIREDACLLIEEGDRIEAGTPIWETRHERVIEVIPLSSLLKVDPSQIAKFLKKKIGENVTTGGILAEKKALFSSSVIKSPIDGILKEMDLGKGTLTLVGESSKKEKFISPVTGKIKNITKTGVEIEIDGDSYNLKRGEGEDAFGKLKYIVGERVGVLDIRDEVEGSLVLAKSVMPEAGIKLEVLGAVGLVVEKRVEGINLPWGEASTEMFSKLVKAAGKKVWLRPGEKQIIINV